MIECYDIGGTNIRAALIHDGEILLLKKVKTHPKELISQIKILSKYLREESSKLNIKHKIKSVSIALPGIVKNNILLNAPPLHINKEIDFEKELKFKEPLFIDNDLNIAARAELKYGYGKNNKNFYLLTISTGIGVGIILNSELIKGNVGEFGHNVIETDKKLMNKCSCNNYGCWVSLCSGYGINLLIEKFLKENISIEELFKRYENKDQEAISLIEKIQNYNAHGIAIMNNILDLDIVVMGSIALKQFKHIIPSEKQIKNYTINKIPKITLTKLGDNIGILGCYLLAQEKTKGL
tara:strand:- start:2416 stop:3300 length:885 start_codon:yes stop_codon:yes gene_type:complete